MGRSVFLFSVIAGIVALVSCANPPEQEWNEAQRALDQARVVEADLYAADTFREAKENLASAQSEIEIESKKSALSRSYDGARELIKSAKHAANRAFYEAKSARERARERANQAVREAHTALERANDSVAKAMGNRIAEGDIDSLKLELDTLETTLADAERKLEMGNYLEASDKAESVASLAQILLQDVARAVKKST